VEPTPAENTAASTWDGSFGHERPPPVGDPTEPTQAPTTEDATPSAGPAGARLQSGSFEVTLSPGIDRAIAQGALSVLEVQASEIDDLLGVRGSSVNLRFTDAAHVDDKGTRLWPAASTVPDLEYPLGGAGGPGDGSFVPAARLLYGRSALHRASEATLPPYLIVGFSLVLEQGMRPPTAVADLVAEGTDIDPSKLDVVLGSNPARTERLLHSYCSWIVAEQGWPKIGKMLEALQRSGDVELSFIQAFGQSPAEIEMEWTAATTGGE
jgi:hypothetical protein